MRIYLAGPANDLARVYAAVAVIEAAGHSITEPWWQRVEYAGARWGADSSVPAYYMAESAERDLDGVARCERMIVLPNSDGRIGTGRACEIGFHVGLFGSWRPPVIVGAVKRGFLLLGKCRQVETMADAIR